MLAIWWVRTPLKPGHKVTPSPVGTLYLSLGSDSFGAFLVVLTLGANLAPLRPQQGTCIELPTEPFQMFWAPGSSYSLLC